MPDAPVVPESDPEIRQDAPPANVLGEALRKQQAAEQSAAALQAKIEELETWKREQEQAQLSELERAQAAQQEAVTRAEQAEQRALRMERSQLVRQAAQKAGFADPDDAVAFLDGQLADLDDADKAISAVNDLAGRKAHLIATTAGTRPAGIGSLTGGHATPPMTAPIGADGEPDTKAGLGQELLAGLFGKR